MAAAVAAFTARPAVAATSGSPLRVTRPVRITTGDNTPTRTYSSPMIAVDPEDANNVLAAYAEMRTARCAVARSIDGGRTWKRLEASPTLTSYPFCFSPGSTNIHQAQIAFGRNHVLYLAFPAWDVQDGRARSLVVARSPDLGDTWSTALVRDARGKTPVELNSPVASIAVDTRGPEDAVYVGFQRIRSVPGATPQPMLVVSTDGARTFSEPVSVMGDFFTNEAVRQTAFIDQPTVRPPGFSLPDTPPDQITADKFGGSAPKVVIDGKGKVYALFVLVSTVVPPPNRSPYLARSTDGGKTFTVSQAVRPSPTLGNPVLRWSPAGGPEGTLHLVYENKLPAAQGDRDIYYQGSTDGGRTWSEPRMLNDDDPKGLAAQFMPNLNVAPNGRIDVAWWDFRNDTGAFLNDVYLASSSDNGRTWSPNVRVSDRAIDRKIGPWSNGFDVRQPVGLTATDRYTIAAWDDTRNGDAETDLQDLYSAFVQFSPLPAGASRTWAYVLAAVVGLFLAGLVTTVVGLASRRRPHPPESHTEPAPESAGVT